MKKLITINGMTCSHCQMRVTKALTAIEGVDDVIVTLSEGQALISANDQVSDKIIKATIKNAGYNVKKIEVIS